MFLPPVLRAAVVVHVRRTWFQMIRLPIRWVRLSFLLCSRHLHSSKSDDPLVTEFSSALPFLLLQMLCTSALPVCA